jgi:sensor histidine kinase YesM
LSDLLRITFDRSGEAKVTLKEEIEFLQKYLDIEQTRFPDRLTVRVEIDPDTLDAEVPRMILQPLVENAIKHGIAPRTDRGSV